ncbi:MAG: hypothetical protein M3Q71_06565 [Chloroflexota bacterium]|nr:hypothetical protein [Chloroflexota bacterium]
MTKPDITRQVLSVEQENAIDLLVSGTSDRETAAAVGVSRQTVCGWRNHHPAFIAALNARRLETWGASSDRLRALLPKALDCLEGAITGEAPDWKAAAKVVELAGLDRQGAGVPNLGPSSIGPTDPEAVLDAEARKRRYDPLADMLDGGRVTETERRAVLRELTDLAG